MHVHTQRKKKCINGHNPTAFKLNSGASEFNEFHYK